MGASFIFGIGAMLLPLVAWVFINGNWSIHIPYLDIIYKPWRLFIVMCGIPGFLCGICLYKIPESSSLPFLIFMVMPIKKVALFLAIISIIHVIKSKVYCLLNISLPYVII